MFNMFMWHVQNIYISPGRVPVKFRVQKTGIDPPEGQEGVDEPPVTETTVKPEEAPQMVGRK